MSERFGHNDEAWAKIADPSTICDRLRGQYNIPVNDGAGPLNGSMVFSRSFQTTPIQNAAADLIDQLQAIVAEQAQEIERLREATKPLRVLYVRDYLVVKLGPENPEREEAIADFLEALQPKDDK